MPDTIIIGLVLLIGFLLAAALSPFEALGWWAGWFGREREDIAQTTSPNTIVSEAKHYVIFLSGIHSVSGDTFARREIALLEALRQQLPEATVLEIFPYSVDNRALTGQRFFAWFWRLALKLKLSKLAFAGFIINMRNVFQVAVSADHRYGPIYNQGTAETMLRALRKHGYLVGSNVPVTLIGYSGGGQVALGAGKFLKEIIRAPVQVISLGGIMASDPGLLELDGVYHLLGKRDRIARLGPILFPARLPVLPYSSWNQAKASGLIQFIDMGPADHTGRDGYLDANATLPDGRTHLEQTVETIVSLVQQSGLSA